MKGLPTILCVDDEPNVLEGLALNLRRRGRVVTATSGLAALAILEEESDVAVVISDMRMPGMNGAAFLARVRERRPHAARILLTGQTDLEAAITAVNDGQIFRFLTKPCAPVTLTTAVDAGLELHRLVTAERVLLEQTLLGSVQMLTDVLALTNPAAFGRGGRIKRLVTDLAESLEIRDRWQLEVAAMFSQLGQLVLPPDTIERVHTGHPLTDSELQMVARAPAVVEQLLANIPRLEGVRGILTECERAHRNSAQDTTDVQKRYIARGAAVLRAALDFDALESMGNPGTVALDTMRGRTGRYDLDVLRALATLRAGTAPGADIRELPIAQLRVGMRFVEDVMFANGTLFIARGYEISPSFLERVKNFPRGTLKEPTRVALPALPLTKT